MSNFNPHALAQFLVLTQIKWKCKNNEVTRTIEDNQFVIRVKRKDDPEKNFTIVLPLEHPWVLKLYMRGAPEIFSDSEEATALMQLIKAVPVSPSVQAKYLESLYILGEVLEVNASTSDALLDFTKLTTETERAYAGFVSMSESDPDVTLTQFAYITGEKGGDRIVRLVARNTDERDNELSGRYFVLTLEETGDSLVEIVFDPDSLEATTAPVDTRHYATIYDNFKKPETDAVKTDFKDVIGNERTSNPDEVKADAPEDKSKYLFPVFPELTADDIAKIIIQECNTTLCSHTVATPLDFDPNAIRIAMTTPHRSWLNLIVAVNNGIAYLNYIPTPASPNYHQAIKIDDLKNMATIGATTNNVQLIRALVVNFMTTAPSPMITPSDNKGGMVASMGTPVNAYRDHGLNRRYPKYQHGQHRFTESAETVKTWEAAIFTTMVLRDFTRAKGIPNQRLNALSNVMKELRLAPLLDSEVPVIQQVCPYFAVTEVSIYVIYTIIKALRRDFEVRGSLPTDVQV